MSFNGFKSELKTENVDEIKKSEGKLEAGITAFKELVASLFNKEQQTENTESEPKIPNLEPRKEYVKDGEIIKTDDNGIIYEKSGEKIPNINYEIDGRKYATDSRGKETDDESSGETSEAEDKDINKRQLDAIKEGLKRLIKGELTSAEKGNLCEMIMDQYYISKGYKPIHKPRVTSLDDSGHQGIDGVYEKTNEDGSKEYIIADAKYDQATLSTTVDGTKQMSDKWIDQRLDASVGKEKADEIRMSDNVTKEVFHMKPDSENQSEGTCDVRGVDDNGEYNSPKENVGEYSPTDFNFDKESDEREG